MKEFLHRAIRMLWPTIPVFNPDYSHPLGIWQVYTEGDDEGKTVEILGEYAGYLDDIAYNLAPKIYYKLTFTKIGHTNKTTYTRNTSLRSKRVHVMLNIESHTWDMTSDQIQAVFQKILRRRKNVIVTDSNFYKSVVLDFTETLIRKTYLQTLRQIELKEHPQYEGPREFTSLYEALNSAEKQWYLKKYHMQ